MLIQKKRHRNVYVLIKTVHSLHMGSDITRARIRLLFCSGFLYTLLIFVPSTILNSSIIAMNAFKHYEKINVFLLWSNFLCQLLLLCDCYKDVIYRICSLYAECLLSTIM